MKLTIEGIKNTAEWESKGYSLPTFDRAAVEAATKANPFWIILAQETFSALFRQTLFRSF